MYLHAWFFNCGTNGEKKKMKNKYVLLFVFVTIFCVVVSFKKEAHPESYEALYFKNLQDLKTGLSGVLKTIEKENIKSDEGIKIIQEEINRARIHLKAMDFWFRYLEPISYKKINGPLPVEWETEVFEKFEAPYKREGAGLTLASLYLEEEDIQKDSLHNLVLAALNNTAPYEADSITTHLKTPHHFFLCNRLFLLNLAAIYTTGFECPDTTRILPELGSMLEQVYAIYTTFNEGFPNTPLPESYLQLYKEAVGFVNHQSTNYLKFDHFTFLRNYVNPLFSLNQKLIRDYIVVSKSYVDYSLNKNSPSIFSKELYKAQNPKGIFLRVYDKEVLAEIDKIGKLLFYDPILSANNLRSCASCHNPKQFFTDTAVASALQFNRTSALPRNSPSLINAQYNHLIMLDGKHISLQNQTKDVITNPLEMASNEKEVLEKILSCGEYKSAFKSFLKYTPQEPEITMEHISSAITMYYSKFSHYYSPFDGAMNQSDTLDKQAKDGFNLFMGKAQCATCHFVPQFNGVKPPYVSSEFEVLGVPKDTTYKELSADRGRDNVNSAVETKNAFRTGTIRNAGKTKPYMHNGSFNSLAQVIDFYNAGGGAGRGLKVTNQTLSADSLHLTQTDKNSLLAFMRSLNEKIEFEKAPEKLPSSKMKKLNARKIGGEY